MSIKSSPHLKITSLTVPSGKRKGIKRHVNKAPKPPREKLPAQQIRDRCRGLGKCHELGGPDKGKQVSTFMQEGARELFLRPLEINLMVLSL